MFIIRIIILIFFGTTLSTAVHGDQASTNSKLNVMGEATVTIDGKSNELLVACNYGSANGLIISNRVFEAKFFNSTQTESRITYQPTLDSNLLWTNEGIGSPTWEREGSQITGFTKVKSLNLPRGQTSETANLMFDIRCEDMPVADNSPGTTEQPEIVKDVGDTAKDQSRREILNETRKGVSDAFRSIFK